MASEEASFSAGDVQEAAGLSYRQINDWENRGALESERSSDRSWRKFTPRELFVLMVCAEMRQKFGVPLGRLRFVREVMEQDEANHFAAAHRLMVILGVCVWILTDFEETFIMDSELEFLLLMELGFFGGEDEKSYAFVKVNPLVNRLLDMMPDVEPLASHGKGYEILREIDSHGRVRSREEAFVLETIRDAEFSRVEVVLDNGDIKTIRTSSKRDATEQLEDLLRRHTYQKLTVVQQDGRIVSIDQQATHKVED